MTPSLTTLRRIAAALSLELVVQLRSRRVAALRRPAVVRMVDAERSVQAANRPPHSDTIGFNI